MVMPHVPISHHDRGSRGLPDNVGRATCRVWIGTVNTSEAVQRPSALFEHLILIHVYICLTKFVEVNKFTSSYRRYWKYRTHLFTRSHTSNRWSLSRMLDCLSYDADCESVHVRERTFLLSPYLNIIAIVSDHNVKTCRSRPIWLDPHNNNPYIIAFTSTCCAREACLLPQCWDGERSFSCIMPHARH